MYIYSTVGEVYWIHLLRDHPYIMSEYFRTLSDPPMAIYCHKYCSECQYKWQLFEPTHPVFFLKFPPPLIFSQNRWRERKQTLRRERKKTRWDLEAALFSVGVWYVQAFEAKMRLLQFCLLVFLEIHWDPKKKIFLIPVRDFWWPHKQGTTIPAHSKKLPNGSF